MPHDEQLEPELLEDTLRDLPEPADRPGESTGHRPPFDKSSGIQEGPGVTGYALDDKNTTTVRTTQIPDEPVGT